MGDRIDDNSEPIDGKTSRSICRAVAERLQESLRPEPSRLPSHLQNLLDEIRRHEADEVTSNLPKQVKQN
jgi:hypothetical protein